MTASAVVNRIVCMDIAPESAELVVAADCANEEELVAALGVAEPTEVFKLGKPPSFARKDAIMTESDAHNAAGSRVGRRKSLARSEYC